MQGSTGDTDIENKLMDMRRRGEVEGVWTEQHGNMYITIRKMDSQWEFSVCLRELRPGLCNNLEGWDGEGGGRKFQEGRHMGIPTADSC